MNAIVEYFRIYGNDYLIYCWEHIEISFIALFFVLITALPVGYFAYKNELIRHFVIRFAQSLRVIPSLGLLFIMIPFLGAGRTPALIALTVLGIPPVLVNTVLGFSSAPYAVIETGKGLGMNNHQLLWKVRLPEAAPYILNGIKLALVEIIASATLATYIGAGGLGVLIFTGLGLYRMDLLLIGGLSVALLSLASTAAVNLLIHRLRY